MIADQHSTLASSERTRFLRQTPEQIVAAAIQEDVDVVGISILSGAHNVLLPEVTERLQREGAEDILVFAGGIIPEKDIPALKDAGIAEVFLPGSSTREIIDYLRRSFDEAPAEAGA